MLGPEPTQPPPPMPLERNDGAPPPFSHGAPQKVSKEEGAQLAAEYGIQFFETSAKEDKNVEKGFITIAREVKDRLMADGPNPGSRGPGGGINLNTPASKKKAGCC